MGLRLQRPHAEPNLLRASASSSKITFGMSQLSHAQSIVNKNSRNWWLYQGTNIADRKFALCGHD
jgi:hypothetical protein